MTRATGGFSLVELMVVVVILGVLATLVVVNIAGADDVAKQKATVTEIASMMKAVTLYKSIVKKYPTSLQQLFTPHPKYANKAFLENGTGQDPWGNPYQFKKSKSGVKISSFGADGAKGGEGVNADIHSDKLHEFK